MSFATVMLDMLTSAYNRTDLSRIRRGEQPKTNIGKLMTLSGWGFDILKEQAEKVKLWDDLEEKRGTELDRYGKDLGVAREGATDEVYRIMIKVKTISLLASGNLDAVILAAASLYQVDAVTIQADEIYPAKIYLYINEDLLDEEHKNIGETIAILLGRIKASGVGLRIFYKLYRTYDASVYFAPAEFDFVRMEVGPGGDGG